MNRILRHPVSARVLGLLAVAALITLAESATAQDKAAVPAAGQPRFQGLRSCVPCHNERIEDKNPFITLSREFCALNEVGIFAHDKHRQAFELLTGDLGQRMEAILRKGYGDPEYKVTTDKKCLACHANWHWKEGFDLPPLSEFGVSCEACHGPSSLWEQPHDEPAWRAMSPDEKEAKFGFIDVRNPIRRTKQCFSCHIGNVQEGKVVTHEMYAAGHPPLPGIEIESFTSQMPSHWRTLREKGEFSGRDRYIEVNFPGQDPLNELTRTKSVLIGGVMALRESVNLFASQSVDNGSKDWPELAVFDCAACHHDLTAPAWRQKRGYGSSIPGRPQMFAWPLALVRVAVFHRAGGEEAAAKKDWGEFLTKFEALKRALDKRPFGDPAAINAAVTGETGLLAWLDKLAADVLASRVQAEDARRALQIVVSLPAEDYPDFNSARQLLWAARSIRAELNAAYPGFKPRPDGETEKASIDRALENLNLYSAWKAGPRAASEKSIDDLLLKLELTPKLQLNLPAGDEYVIAQQLPESLKMAAAYDPAWFRAQLAALAKELDEKKP